MKRIFVLALVVLLMAANFSGCELFEQAPDKADVEEAVGIAIGVYFVALFTIGFGGDLEGVTLNESNGVLTFSSFDISDMDTDYSSVSGTVGPTNSGDLAFDLSFKGGPIEDLEFDLGSDDLDSTSPVTLDVEANGFDFDLTLTPADYDE